MPHPTITGEMIRAALESRAVDDEGEFKPLLHHFRISSVDSARTVVRAALEAALDQGGIAAVIRDQSANLIESMIFKTETGRNRPVGERAALAIAASAVRRGRLLSGEEMARNLAKGLADSDEAGRTEDQWIKHLFEKFRRADPTKDDAPTPAQEI